LSRHLPVDALPRDVIHRYHWLAVVNHGLHHRPRINALFWACFHFNSLALCRHFCLYRSCLAYAYGCMPYIPSPFKNKLRCSPLFCASFAALKGVGLRAVYAACLPSSTHERACCYLKRPFSNTLRTTQFDALGTSNTPPSLRLPSPTLRNLPPRLLIYRHRATYLTDNASILPTASPTLWRR